MMGRKTIAEPLRTAKGGDAGGEDGDGTADAPGGFSGGVGKARSPAQDQRIKVMARLVRAARSEATTK